MRVLQINTFCGSGSTGRIATDLYDVLVNDGHDCCIAYGRGRAPKSYKSIKIGNDFSIYSHVLKTRLFDMHGFGSKNATKKFIKKIEAFQPDIIHLHNLHGYYLNIEILFNYLSELSIPIVWLMHDQWAFSGHSAYFKLDKNGRIPFQNLDKRQISEYPKSFFKDKSKTNYLRKEKLFTKINNMTIITPSIWLSELVKQSFFSKYEIKVINNGIDLSKFKPTENNFRKNNNLENKKIILGVASVWEDRKGLKYFNELASLLDDTFKIILIGVNKKQKRKLNTKILAMYRTESIEELVECYSTADLFVNPTLEDNFPTTNIEALACGTPVLTFDTGGSPEMLNNSTGKVIEQGNISKLYTAITSYTYDEKLLSLCVKRAEKFNKETIYRRYINLYKEIYEKHIQ